MKPNALALLPVTLFTLFAFSCGSADKSESKPNSPPKNYSDASITADSTKSSANTQAPGFTEAGSQNQNDPKDKIAESENEEQNTLRYALAFNTSAAHLNKLDSTHRFIRTADVKFRVNDVASSTYLIEEITTHFGGYVADTKLTSDLISNYETPVSADSSLQTMRYVVSNTLTLRVPASKLDSALKAMVPLVDYLDYRNVNTNDITLDILTNRLAQARIAKYNNRLTTDIDVKGNKLPDIQGAEDALLRQQENSDNALVENLRMNDRVEYATVNLNLYQRENIRQGLVKREKTVSAYEPGLGSKLSESFSTGWSGFRLFLGVVVMMWPLWLLAASIIFSVRFYIRKKAK